jgi:hypothetical protein
MAQSKPPTRSRRLSHVFYLYKDEVAQAHGHASSHLHQAVWPVWVQLVSIKAQLV